MGICGYWSESANMLTLITDQSNHTTAFTDARKPHAMTNLFLLHAPEDPACSEILHTGLATRGYRIWQDTHSLEVSDILYPHAAEHAVPGSAVVLRVWSRGAAWSHE